MELFAIFTMLCCFGFQFIKFCPLFCQRFKHTTYSISIGHHCRDRHPGHHDGDRHGTDCRHSDQPPSNVTLLLGLLLSFWKPKPSCGKGTSTGHRSVPARLRYFVEVGCNPPWRVLAQRRPLCSDAQLLCREWRSPHRCRPTTKLEPRARVLATEHSITSVRSDISNLRRSTCKLTALLRMIATL